jgi:hypothetical protein
MSSADEVQFVFFEEDLDDLGTEHVRDASFIFSPALHVLIGIRPKKIAKKS